MSPRLSVIFAHARTGSENLCRTLGSGSGKPALSESFNPRYPLWGEPGPYEYVEPKTRESLYETIDDIEQSYSGLKTMTYQLTPSLNEALACRQETAAIFLYRRDVIAAAVSQEVGMISSHWHTFGDASVAQRNARMQIDPVAVAGHVRRFLEAQRWMKEMSMRTNSPYLSYEEIYDNDDREAEEVVSRMCDSIEVAPPNSTVAKSLLSRDVVPIRYQHRITNLTDVVDACRRLTR